MALWLLALCSFVESLLLVNTYAGNIKWSGGLVSDCNKFPSDKRGAIDLAERGIGICLGTRSFVGQNVGDNSLITTLSRIIDCSIGGSAEAL